MFVKKIEGLGVRGLTNLNIALLRNWSWRFANERDSLWRSVIVIKSREEEGGGVHVFLRDLTALVCGKR